MDFRILSNGEGQKKFELFSKEVYTKPSGANCIHVRAGKICFGKISFREKNWKLLDTNIGAIFFKQTQKSRFFKLPTSSLEKKEIGVSFPEYYYNKHGHNYGRPEFHDFLPCPLLLSYY